MSELDLHLLTFRSTVQRQSGDRRLGPRWCRGRSRHHHQRWRVRDSDGLTSQLSELALSGSSRREAASIKCNVLSWDDQLSLFELAFERYGAVDVVVRTPSFLQLPCAIPNKAFRPLLDPKRRNHRNPPWHL